MKFHSMRLRIIICVVITTALAISQPVTAGYWTESTSFAGIYGASRIGLFPGDSFYNSLPWGTPPGTSFGITPHIETCFPNLLSGSCFSYGSVTRTLTYVPVGENDPGPPAKVMIEESAGVSVPTSDCSYNDTNRASTFTRNSLGTANQPGGTTTIRRTWVDSSSGVISRTVFLSAVGQIGPWSKAHASVSYIWLHILNPPYNAPVADRTVVEAPGRMPSQAYYPGPACHNHNYGGAASNGDPVNLATGEHLYVPASDLTVYNPYGPSVSYQRNFFSKIAKEGKSSPGLPVGWIDGYDVKVKSTDPASWSNLELIYPNSAKESPFIPVLENGVPTNEFTEPTGSYYFVTGVPTTTVGEWSSLTITFKDRTKWIFSRVSSDTYMLSAITNRMGRSINIIRDAQNQNRVLAINDDQVTPVTLVSFSYTNGLLSQLADVYGRKIRFGYEDISGVTCLKTMSQISTSDTAPVAVQYGYQLLGSLNRPHLTSVTIPSPKGTGTSTESFDYDSEVRVSAMVDANLNRHEFSYECPDATRVKVKDPTGAVKYETLMIFDPTHGNVFTGNADADGANTARTYGDPNHPLIPTKITGKLGDTTEMTYDGYGNVLTVKNARGTITKYTYDYTVFPLGRLIEVDEAYNLLATDPAKRPKTTISYYEPSGLIQSVTYPAPGSTGPGGATVTASFTYDLVDNPSNGTRGLGNILTSVRPGNNAAANITTTYDYGPYADVKIGQPLTITVCDANDPSPTKTKTVVHLQYDDRGNLTSSTDALGNRLDFTFNVADQLLSTILPSTSQQ